VSATVRIKADNRCTTGVWVLLNAEQSFHADVLGGFRQTAFNSDIEAAASARRQNFFVIEAIDVDHQIFD
jgi:hypothetical protein